MKSKTLKSLNFETYCSGFDFQTCLKFSISSCLQITTWIWS